MHTASVMSFLVLALAAGAGAAVLLMHLSSRVEKPRERIDGDYKDVLKYPYLDGLMHGST